MNDILPPDSGRWEWVESRVRALMQRYGYLNVRTPIVEPTALFVRGLGEVTDIVEKEMYSFIDSMNGDPLTLRPENTAGVVRAVVEHSMLRDGGKRLFYIGPMFRHERPQKGRYRQFHQVGAEALGFTGPDVDAELILMCRALWRDLSLQEGRDVRLELNSLGQLAERKAHRQALVSYLQDNATLLDDEARARMHSNPLRILDTKNPAMQALADGAPKLMDFLGAESLDHFAAVRAVLDGAGLDYRINPRLVRGMDYYNLTVFEWTSDRLGSQAAVCGGGRYDTLVEQLGGKASPAVGWGLGLERLLLLLEAAEVEAPAAPPDAYAIIPASAPLAVVIPALETLRAGGVRVLMNSGGGSIKTQFKRADNSGARFAIVFGEDELQRGEVAVKPLRDANAEQLGRPLATIESWAVDLLPA